MNVRVALSKKLRFHILFRNCEVSRLHINSVFSENFFILCGISLCRFFIAFAQVIPEAPTAFRSPNHKVLYTYMCLLFVQDHVSSVRAELCLLCLSASVSAEVKKVWCVDPSTPG